MTQERALEPLLLDVIFRLVGPDVRQAIEEAMDRQNYRFRIPWLREQFEKGKAEGMLEQARGALLRTLQLRGFDVPAKVEKLISKTTELWLLEDWQDRAVTAESLSGIFDLDDGKGRA